MYLRGFEETTGSLDDCGFCMMYHLYANNWLRLSNCIFDACKDKSLKKNQRIKVGHSGSKATLQ